METIMLLRDRLLLLSVTLPFLITAVILTIWMMGQK